MSLTQELGKEIVEASIVEFRQLQEMWQSLERKAQVTITTAGVFLAAIFAFIRIMQDTNGFEKLLLIVATGLLLLTIFTASRVLLLKIVDRIPSGQEMTDWADRLINAKSDGTDNEKMWDYYTNRAAQWQAVSFSLEESYNEKLEDLRTAQNLLLGALLAVCLTAIYNIF